jgi:hypothetical protein
MKRILKPALLTLALIAALTIAYFIQDAPETSAPPPTEIQAAATTTPTTTEAAIAAATAAPPTTAMAPATTAAPETEPPTTAPATTAAPTTTAPATTEPEPVAACRVTVSCATVLGLLDTLPAGTAALIPADGILLSCDVPWQDGDTAYTLLQRAAQAQGFQLEATTTPLTGTVYLEGLGNLYAFDAGPLSGWIYRVGEVFPSVSCDRAAVAAGQAVDFLYTCDLGADIGAPDALGGQS